jgi:ABC-2 type transport system permease protein
MYAEPYTYGIMYTQLMTVWVLILIAVMNFFLVSRHTRRDEEDGRIEVLRSLPVGRASILSSALIVAVLANVATGLLCGIGLAATSTPGMDLSGCLLLGAIYTAVGLLFAAVAMLFSQLCSSSRSELSGNFLTLGLFYTVAAMGNVSGGALSYISPLGIVFKTVPFAGNKLYPIWIILAEALIIAVIAIRLNAARDLGAGLLPQRNGRAHAKASLSSPFALALRLMKNTAIIWTVSMFVLGLMYGSVFGDFESFMSKSKMIQTIIAAGSGDDLLMSFMTYIMLVMAVITAIPVINCVLKLRSEERKNRLEEVYALAVSKTDMFLPYIIIGAGLSLLLTASLAAGLWLAANVVMATPFALTDVLIAGACKLPGIWLLAGVGILLTGLLPKLTALVWVYYGLSFFVIYIGRMMDLPKLLLNISAFGALPDSPLKTFQTAPFIMVTAAAAILTAAGVLLYARRDVSYN